MVLEIEIYFFIFAFCIKTLQYLLTVYKVNVCCIKNTKRNIKSEW